MPNIFQRNPGGSFYIRIVRGEHQKWISLRTKVKKEAERRAGRILYGTLPALLQAAVEKPKTTMQEAWEEYEKTQAAKTLKFKYLAAKKVIWVEFAKYSFGKYFEDMTPSITGKYLESIIERSSVANARNHKAMLSSVWASIRHLHPGIVDPWESLPPLLTPQGETKHTQSMTPEMVKTILDSLRTREDGLYGMALVSLHTGARLIDVVHMRHEYLKAGYIVFLPEKTIRKGRPVRIPIHPAIRGFFHEGETGYLWPDEVARYKSSKAAHSMAFKRAFVGAGLAGDRLSFHSFRATFISQCERMHIERRAVQSAVGHTKETQTGEYSDLTIRPDEIEKLSFVQ